MSKLLGWGAILAALFVGLGCSGRDSSSPDSEGVAEAVAALRDGPGGASAARVDSVLVSLADGTLHEFSTSGEDLGIFAQGGLSNPMGLALDRLGNVYVANAGNDTVHAFSPSGLDLGVFASTDLSEPLDLAFDAAGNLWVSNGGDNSIRRFSPKGEVISGVVSLLGRGCPGGLSVAASGNLLVADQCASVIREFSPSAGKRHFCYGGPRQPGPIELRRQRGLARGQHGQQRTVQQ